MALGFNPNETRQKITSPYFKTQKEADAWRRQTTLDRDHGVALAERGSVGDLLREWPQHGRNTKDWSPTRARRSAQIVRDDLAPLVKIRASELTVQQVESVLNAKRGGGVAPNTLRLIRAALSAALKLAVRRGQLHQNVAALAAIPTVRQMDPRFLEPDQAQAFMNSLDGQRLGPLFVTTMSLALRPSEAVGLRWEDVNLQDRRVTIEQNIQYEDHQYMVNEPKTDMSRRVLPLPLFLAERLRDHRVARLEESKSRRAGIGRNPGSCSSHDRRAALRAVRESPAAGSARTCGTAAHRLPRAAPYRCDAAAGDGHQHRGCTGNARAHEHQYDAPLRQSDRAAEADGRRPARRIVR